MTRRRWVYTEGGKALDAPVEVTQEWKDPGIGPSNVSEAEVYGKLSPATDGTSLDSRTKHREYMKRNNLTLADDYKGTWEKAAREREAFYRGDSAEAKREAKEDAGRAIYEARRRRK